MSLADNSPPLNGRYKNNRKAGGSDLDFDVRALDTHTIAPDWLACRRTKHLAAGDIEGRAMPGTCHLNAINLAFTQWTADMCTVVIDGVKRTGDVEERYFFTANVDQPGLAGRNFICFGNFYELWH